MIAGYDVGCLAFIELVGLASLVNIADEGIRPPCCIEIEVVLSCVSPFIAIAKRNPHHFRMVVLQSFEGISEGEGIEMFATPISRHSLHHSFDKLQFGCLFLCDNGFVRNTCRNAGQLVVDGETSRFPRTIHHDFALVTRVFVGCLQDVSMRIIDRIVSLNGLIHHSSHHFRVTWIGDIGLVGKLHHAVDVSVANEKAFFGDSAPSEGHQRLSPFFWSGTPIGLPRKLGVANLLGVGKEILFRSHEDFLPTKAVYGNDNQPVVLVPLCQNQQGKDG